MSKKSKQKQAEQRAKTNEKKPNFRLWSGPSSVIHKYPQMTSDLQRHFDTLALVNSVMKRK